MKSLVVYFTDNKGIEFNDSFVTNYNDLYRWLITNSDLPFVVKRDNGLENILYKHSIRDVHIKSVK